MTTKSDETLVLSVPEAGKLIGCSRNKSYQLANQGKLPGLIRLNGRMVVSKAKFLRWLNGDDAEGDASAESEEGEASAREQEMNDEDLEALQKELERAARQAEMQDGEGDEEKELSQAQAEAQRRAQEQQQAMEQWLRRIPNDPGGLLRRKFRYQYQRQGRDQDGNELWPDDEVHPW